MSPNVARGKVDRILALNNLMYYCVKALATHNIFPHNIAIRSHFDKKIVFLSKCCDTFKNIFKLRGSIVSFYTKCGFP